MNTPKLWLKLLRVSHYSKNFLILAPLFFAGGISDTESMLLGVIAIFGFSLASSAVYIINDYFDRELDQNHPVKRFRPLASGEIQPLPALILAGILIAISAMTFFLLNLHAFGFLVAYLVINLSYSLGLKHIPGLDILFVASGFIIRLLIGSIVCDIELSMWIILMTFLLASFLALSKRKSDLQLSEKYHTITRKSIQHYNSKMLHSGLYILASLIIICYLLYTLLSQPTGQFGFLLPLSSLWVSLGIIRYLFITMKDVNQLSPEQIVLTDHWIQASIILWLATCSFIFYA